MSRARSWLTSASKNFTRIRGRHAKSNPCGLIEHYTDVAAEASVAAVLADDEGDASLAKEAERMVGRATRAQRGATKACSLGIRAPRDD